MSVPFVAAAATASDQCHRYWRRTHIRTGGIGTNPKHRCRVPTVWIRIAAGAQPLLTPARRHGDGWPAGPDQAAGASPLLRNCHLSRGDVRRTGPRTDIPHARRTPLLRTLLERIGVALAGRAGARLATHLGIAVSRSSLLRLVRALPDPQIGSLKVLGVDDFALRRGHAYGTVLVDIDTHTPVDLLADRSADTFAAWLDEHPGIEVVCRDRATTYAEATRKAAPNAIQVADRWHLWHNLAEHVEKTVAAHHSCLRHHNDIPSKPPGGSGPAADLIQAANLAQASRRENSTLVTRTKARYQAVHALKTQGKGIKAIMGELGLSKDTVRRFYRAGTAEELLAIPAPAGPAPWTPTRPTSTNDGTPDSPTRASSTEKSPSRDTGATGPPSPATSHHSVHSAPHHRQHPQYQRSATSPPGYSATPTTSTTTTKTS